MAGETPWTPPPWSVVTRPDGTMVILKRDANGNPEKHIAEMAWADSEGGEHDARLAAAAPEMAEAIRDWAEYWGNEDDDLGDADFEVALIERFRALISKITGEA